MFAGRVRAALPERIVCFICIVRPRTKLSGTFLTQNRRFNFARPEEKMFRAGESKPEHCRLGHFFPPAHFLTHRSGFILPRLDFFNLDALNALKKRVEVQKSRSVQP